MKIQVGSFPKKWLAYFTTAINYVTGVYSTTVNYGNFQLTWQYKGGSIWSKSEVSISPTYKHVSKTCS